MRRRVMDRQRATPVWKAEPSRTPGAGPRSKLPWREARWRGVAAHRSLRLVGIGIAIGGERQRRLRAARAH